MAIGIAHEMEPTNEKLLMRLRSVYGPRWPWLLTLYFSLAIICGYISWSRVVVDENGVVWTNQGSVDRAVEMVLEEPNDLTRGKSVPSRVLVPYIIVGANKYLGVPYNVTHDATRLMFIFLAALLLHWHLRTWFSLHEALTGTALMLATITIIFNSWIPIPTDFPELIGMTICTALLVRQRWVWMLVALIVYTFNRESSIIFLVPAAFCFLLKGRESIPRTLAVTGAVAVVGLTTFMVARGLAGVGTAWIVPPEASGQNQLLQEVTAIHQVLWQRRLGSIMGLLRSPHPYNVNWSPFLLFNIFWVLPLIAWRSIPEELKRLYVGGLLGGFFVFILVGILNEAGRHMLPLFPLLYPAGLHVLFRHVTAPDDRGSTTELREEGALC